MNDLKKITEDTKRVPYGLGCSVCHQDLSIDDNDEITHTCEEITEPNYHKLYDMKNVDVKTNIKFRLSGHHGSMSYSDLILNMKTMICQNTDITFSVNMRSGRSRVQLYRHLKTNRTRKRVSPNNLHEYEFVYYMNVTIME